MTTQIIVANWQVILWTIVLIVIVIVMILFAITAHKYKSIVTNAELQYEELGSSDLQNEVNKIKEKETEIEIITFTKELPFYLTREFFDNAKVVYIEYYKQLSIRRLVGYLPSVSLTVLSGLEDMSYRVYLENEIFPCNYNTQVEGYWVKDTFYITNVIGIPVDADHLPIKLSEIGKTDEEIMD